mmetsp:Transcript_4593/g.12813  ORF Transcript_4593/g.12813 Transcript_4593/m.12813 type:complete len:340 (+) Transcript_4593:67-1086(+)
MACRARELSYSLEDDERPDCEQDVVRGIQSEDAGQGLMEGDPARNEFEKAETRSLSRCGRAPTIAAWAISPLLLVLCFGAIYQQSFGSSAGYSGDGSVSLWRQFPLTHHNDGEHSLYCWAFTQMHGSEPTLLALQQRMHWGIFACDAHVVLSTLTGWTNGVRTHGLGHNPTYYCQGQGGTRYACNSAIFIKAWNHIVKVRRYFHYDWTVKVDPDSVFFPSRLKYILGARVGDGKVMFLHNVNNFPSMLGPIEVISRGGLYRYMFRHKECTEQLKGWIASTGEDDFMARCFGQVLKISSQLETDLLHNANNAVDQCGGTQVVFHAFKTPDMMTQCYQHAR